MKVVKVDNLEALLGQAERVAIQFGAAASDAELDEVLELTHDALIDGWPIRLGPVHWALYSPADVDRLTQQAGGEYAGAGGDGLREFCRANPAGHLVLAGVAVPG